MSDDYPAITTYMGGPRSNPALRVEVDFGKTAHVMDLPTAIRLRDRLTQAIADAQAPTNPEPIEYEDPNSPFEGV